MYINADFSQPAVVTPDQYHWKASPQSGVERVMLDRIGEEKARATSIVRYAPHSQFPYHEHPGGEEILVLSGTFSEADCHYPVGWYMRNPPGSSHEPYSEEGAILFVKLCQMQSSESRHVRVDTTDPKRWITGQQRESCPLYSDDVETVSLERLEAGEPLFYSPVQGAEILILDGTLRTQDRHHDRGSWIRLPVGEYPEFTAGEKGATLYLKTGHLAKPPSHEESA